ncbi:hypothetical protein GGI13_003161 [Coemansia sp. RSA 455]|nr:hypothetical protein LPJ71_006853 [Coemansia sp. S17]KAJ2014825.1 hypothetical protein GGI14_004628 [Coemansia sp. S680]KAJ2252640.1 hypothetical protein GGI13_003161 [Coemansia sp. RSA 455]
MLTRCWSSHYTVCRAAIATQRRFVSKKSATNSLTGALCVIGDEILSGKTLDINSFYFAKRCFELGVQVEKIEIVPDQYESISNSLQRLSQNHDIVFTSGGIGPTHDDITYDAVSRAFGSKLAYHEDTLARMRRIMKSRGSLTMPDPQGTAEQIAMARMALLPANAQVVYPCEEYWVPVVSVMGRVHVFPGIPKLFENLVDAYLPGLVARLSGETVLAFTRALVGIQQRESAIAPILDKLQERYAPMGVKIGSYPDWVPKKQPTTNEVSSDWKPTVVVSVVGKNKEQVEACRAEICLLLDGIDLGTNTP